MTPSECYLEKNMITLELDMKIYYGSIELFAFIKPGFVLNLESNDKYNKLKFLIERTKESFLEIIVWYNNTKYYDDAFPLLENTFYKFKITWLNEDLKL